MFATGRPKSREWPAGVLALINTLSIPVLVYLAGVPKKKSEPESPAVQFTNASGE